MAGQRGRDTRTGRPAGSAKPKFGGKRAAPFDSGGKRNQDSPRTHEGKLRKKKSGA